MVLHTPKTSTEKQRDQFRQLGERQAAFIRGGGLLVKRPGRWAQVHNTAYEPLARINLSGLITFDSQDAVDDVSGRVKTWERAYVRGIMLPDDALTFVNNINMWNDDKIAMINMELSEYQPQGAAIAVTRTFDVGSETWVGTRALLAYTFGDWTNQIRHMLQLPNRFVKFSEVQIFDTKWGRPARSKNGLFNAVLEGLDPTIIHPYIEGEPRGFMKRGRPGEQEKFKEWLASFSEQ